MSRNGLMDWTAAINAARNDWFLDAEEFPVRMKTQVAGRRWGCGAGRPADKEAANSRLILQTHTETQLDP